MADYYNATRAPLNLPLRTGESVSIPPKQWISLSAVEEGSDRVVRYIQKGWLVKSRVAAVSEAPVAVQEAPAAIKTVEVQEELPAPTIQEAVAKEAEALDESEPSEPDISNEGSKRKSRRDRR